MKKILLILLFAVFYTSVNAQCSITATTNASALTCGTAPVSACGGILYIGNGTTAMSLNMDADLDLTCLGAIQFIIRNNATLDFSGGNYDLKLASGSSVILQSGSNINSGGSCSASDRIYIGGSVVANCNGSGSIPSFPDIIANGGINQAGILSGNQYICTSGTTTTTFTSTAGSGGTWSSGNSLVATVNSSTGVVTAVSAGTAVITYTKSGVSATRNVYVSSSAPAQPGGVSGITPQCPGLAGQVYSVAAVSGVSSYTWTVPTGWSITAGQGTASITVTTGSSSQSGNLMVTASNACGTSNTTYYYVNINTAISTSSPTANNIPVDNGYCGYKMLSWNQVSNAIGYYLDIATDSGFTNFVTGYQNYNVAYNNGGAPVYNLPNGTLYYRIRAYDNCNVSNYSATRTIIVSASPNSGTLASSQTICSGTQPANLVLTGNAVPVIRWESSNEISFNTKQDIASTSNTLTGAVIGNLTQNTYFRAVTSLNTQMPSGQWCDGYSTLVLITVINTISPASSSPTLCINTAMTNITHTTNGFTGISNNGVSGANGLPAGVSASFANNIITISGTPTASGTFNYSIPVTGGSCGTSNATGTIRVNPLPAAAGTITGTATVCQGQTGVGYSVSAITDATSYTWSYSGTGATVTNGTTNTPTIAFSTTATSGNLTVRGTNSCGNGTVSANYAITVNPLPVAAGTITGIATVCQGQTSVGYSVPVITNASSYTWAYSGTGATVTNGTTNTPTIAFSTTATSGNLTVRGTNSCGNGTVSANYAITVNPLPVAAGTITGTATVCQGQTSVGYSVPVITNASSYTWAYSGTGAVFTNGTTNTPTITFASNATSGNLTVRGTNSCGNGTVSANYAITVNPLPVAAGTITGTATVCQGQTSVGYSVPVITNASSYTWAYSGTGAVFTNGTTNTPTITFASNATSGNLTVRGTNSCGNGTVSANYAITVNPLPVAAGTITGTATVCQGQTGVGYSVPAITNATSYTWSYSGTGATFTNGTTNAPTIAFSSTATSGNLTVYGVNSCGNGTVSANYAITINSFPVAAGTITGTATVCQGQTGVGYSVPAITNATSYTWSYSGTGATFTNGTTNAPTIAFSSTATSGNLTVYGVNSCGNGTISGTYAVTVNPRPTPTFTTAAQAQTCGEQHITYATQTGQSNYVWTVSGVLNTDYRLIARGTSTNYDIVIEWLTSGTKTVSVNYNNSNGCNAASPATYTTDVVLVDKGQVNGGREDLCKVDALPTLTLHSIAGNTIAYPDPSLILKWQYSDNADNSNWQDILGTAGVVSYTPVAFPGAFRTYQVVLQSPNGCTKTSIESRIRIVAFAPPSSGTIVSTTCAGSTGSVVLNGLPTGNWTLYRTGTSSATITGTGSSTTISNLAAGTYNFTYKEGNCTSDPLVVNITRLANIWDGTKWSKTNNTTLPTSDDAIVFEGNYTVASDISGCSCTVNSGNVTVNSGRTLTIKNEVTVNGGTLTFENNASLLQDINTTVNNNSGSITYKRSSQAMKRYDFTYWSSPVEGQTLYGLSPNTRWDKYLSYTGAVWKEELSSSVMQPGIGYIIRVPEPNVTYPNGEYWNTSSYVQTLSFVGKPNNGNITSSQYMEKDKYYLIGNPYPSAIHADAFLYDNINNRGILGGTVYFWTHNTAIKLVGTKYTYVSDDYASYNLTGGVASAPSDPNHDVNGVDNGIKPTGYIAAGQSFFTSAESGSGNVEFTNEMRFGGTRNSQFFKPGKTSKSGVMEKHRLWLNLTNAGGAFKQTLIGYIEGATNTYDKIFDGFSYDGNSYIDFYSINETANLTIQGRALPFSDADVVPLGYRSSIAGEFTISIDQADGNLATQRIYLEDKQLGTINELTAKNYTFTTKAGTFKNRFVLRYSNKTLGTGDFETEDDAVWVVSQNKTLTVNSTVENIDKVFIYDVSGKQLYKKDNVSNLQLILQNQPFAQQVLLVKIVLDNGYQTTKKVIFK